MPSAGGCAPRQRRSTAKTRTRLLPTGDVLIDSLSWDLRLISSFVSFFVPRWTSGQRRRRTNRRWTWIRSGWRSIEVALVSTSFQVSDVVATILQVDFLPAKALDREAMDAEKERVALIQKATRTVATTVDGQPRDFKLFFVNSYKTNGGWMFDVLVMSFPSKICFINKPHREQNGPATSSSSSPNFYKSGIRWIFDVPVRAFLKIQEQVGCLRSRNVSILSSAKRSQHLPRQTPATGSIAIYAQLMKSAVMRACK